MTATVHGTLEAGVEKVEILDAIIRGFRVTHRGTEGDADIWWRWGVNTATPATIGGAGTYNLPAAQQDEELDPALARQKASQPLTGTVFRLISAEAVAYSVETW